MVETSSVPPRKSSVIFACPKNVRKRSSLLRNNFGKSSEIFGKSSKTSSLVCFCNKQNIICPLVDMNFIFSCSTRYLTRSLRSLVRYRVEHSKIKFISTRGHVISSIKRKWFSLASIYLSFLPLIIWKLLCFTVKYGAHKWPWQIMIIWRVMHFYVMSYLTRYLYR